MHLIFMTTLSLPADLGIESAGPLHQQLAHSLEQSAPLHVDAGHVSRIHSASIQVLCAWLMARNKRGYKTLFSPISAVLSDAITVLGLRQCLVISADGSPSTVENNV